MNTSDILCRVAGGVMLMSSMWNGFFSLMWFAVLIWGCIGVLWLVPMALCVVYFAIGIAMIAMGDKARFAGFAPIMGMFISVCNFNMLGGMLDLVALILGIIGFATYEEPE